MVDGFLVTGMAIVLGWIALLVLRPLAYRVDLLDRPTHKRKHHRDAVPLVGGIAVFLTLLLVTLLLPTRPETDYVLVGAGVLVLVGALDDRYQLGVGYRLVAQIVAMLILTLGAGVTLESLGDLFGFGELRLGWTGVPLTVLAGVGIINAFNMIDGIDGLASGLALTALVGLGALMLHAGDVDLLAAAIIGALLAFLVFNFGRPGPEGRKVFLGDAGSMLLGYLLVWLLVRHSQAESSILLPATALWLVAIPLMDTLTVMLRRLLHGHSIFHADRRHLHFMLMRLGLSPLATTLLLLSTAVLLAGFGVLAQLNGVAESWIFLSGLALFTLYSGLLTQPRRFYRTISRWLRRAPESVADAPPRGQQP